MPPDDSKLARLLPGIAARSAETQESVRKNAKKEEAAATLPSAYAGERKSGVGIWSISCLTFSLLLGMVAFALTCAPSAVANAEHGAGAPLQFWRRHSPDVLLDRGVSSLPVIVFLVDGLFWLAAALSVWGACHWLIVRCYSRRWKFSLADMLIITSAAAFLFGAGRMDISLRNSPSASHLLQTVSENEDHQTVYRGPLLVPISKVSIPSFLFFCLAGGSIGINLFHIVDRYALQMRQLK
ncbi:MAG: hypothetical protein ACKVP0_16735 [Pirellulaceae bacterium]